MRPARLAKLVAAASVAMIGLMLSPVVASASGVTVNVPCIGQTALINAILIVEGASGGTINLSPGCHYALTVALGNGNGLPPIRTTVTLNGNGATLDGTNSVRVLEVDQPANAQ
jgi:hypothetical protein